jgi:hypothetical protein
VVFISKRKPIPYEECHKIINGIEYKFCSDCNEWLPMTSENYYKNNKSPDGFNPYCKEDTKRRSKQWQQVDNRKRYLSNKKIYNKEINQMDKYKKIYREHARDQRESGYYREYQQKNTDKFSLYSKDKRENKTHKITDDQWENCKNYFNYRCAYCELPIEEHYINYRGNIQLGDFHKEHVDDEGSNDISNCIPSCKICNSSKHTSSLEEWYNEDNPNFTHERLDRIHKWLVEDYKLI